MLDSIPENAHAKSIFNSRVFTLYGWLLFYGQY